MAVKKQKPKAKPRAHRDASRHLSVDVHRQEVLLADRARERSRLLNRSAVAADATRVARGEVVGGAASLGNQRPTTDFDPRDATGARLTGPLKLQGTGDKRCVAFATASAMETFLSRHNNRPLPAYSVRHIFELSGKQELLGPTALGVAEGVFEHACFPRLPECTAPDGRRWRVAMHRFTPPGDAIAEMCAALREGTVLVISILVFKNFETFNGAGRYKPSGKRMGAHALPIVGYEFAADGSGAWLVQNSFGPAWGDQGFGRLAWSDPQLDPERVVFRVASVVRKEIT